MQNQYYRGAYSCLIILLCGLPSAIQAQVAATQRAPAHQTTTRPDHSTVITKPGPAPRRINREHRAPTSASRTIRSTPPQTQSSDRRTRRTSNRETRSRHRNANKPERRPRSTRPPDQGRVVRASPRQDTHHRINRSHAWSNRDSAGVNFGARRDNTIRKHRNRVARRHESMRDRHSPYFAPGFPARMQTLPRHYRAARHNRQRWIETGGHWYFRNRRGGFELALPPVDLRINWLPDGMRRVIRNGRVYYVSRHYTVRRHQNRYRVVSPEEHAFVVRGSHGHWQTDAGVLYFSAIADIYADPLDEQTEENFIGDLNECMAAAESVTGLNWADNDIFSNDEATKSNPDINALRRENQTCLEVAGYEIY